jgi:ribonuclease HI
MLFEPDFTIFVDGASRGNPGEASYGFAVLDKNGKVIHKESDYIGRATNNVAEYTALLSALEFVLKKGISSVRVCSDSLLLVKQILGEYKVKSEHLGLLNQQIRELLKKFEWFEIQHVPREKNRLADKLANEALDREKESRRKDG